MQKTPLKKTNRVEKVNSLIEHLLGSVMLPYVRDQKGIITVRKVDTSKDMRWAKVWITIVNDDDNKILKTLKNNIYDIQGELNRLIEMKIVPRVSFHLDTTARYAEHINQIFKKIEQEREHGEQAEHGE